VTALHALTDLYRFSTVQITVQYRCVFVLLFGWYSRQLDNKIEYTMALMFPVF